MPEFDFGSLIPQKEKVPKKTTKKTDEKSPKKDGTLKKSPSKTGSPKKKTKSSHEKRSISLKNSQQLLEKIESLEYKIELLNKKLDLVNGSGKIKPNNHEQVKEFEADQVKEFKDKLDYKENEILRQPPISEILPLQENHENIDWYLIFKSAKLHGWLQHIYTFTRYLQLIDEIFISKQLSPMNLHKKWNKIRNRGVYLEQLNIDWDKDSLKRLGKTQKDLIDTFSYFKNEPQTSLDLFNYLVIKDPGYYDKDNDKNIDLRRVRNVLSQLNQSGLFEKLRGKDTRRYFRIKV